MMQELKAVKASKGEVEKEVNKLREHFENKMSELEHSEYEYSVLYSHPFVNREQFGENVQLEAIIWNKE